MKKSVFSICLILLLKISGYAQTDIQSFIFSEFEYEIKKERSWLPPWSILIKDDGFELGYTCASFIYTPNVDHLHGTSDYLVMDLKQPLVPGKVYEFTVDYSIDGKAILDNYFPDHLGVALTYKDPMFGHHKIKNVCSKFFRPNKYKEEQSFQFSFRPLNHVNYIAIGTFRDDDEDSYEEDLRVEHYKIKVKKVQLRELLIPDSTVFIEEYKAKEYVSQPSRVLDFTFESKVYELPDNAKDKVTAFVDSVKQLNNFNGVFEIRGYTDTIGSFDDNIELAFKRINSIYNLLGSDTLNTIKIPFTEDASGTKKVAIQPSRYSMGNAFYTHAIIELNHKNIDACFRLLKKSIYTLPDDQKIILIIDPRLAEFRKNKKWKEIEIQIKKSYDKFAQPNLAFKLDSLYLQDQYFRSFEGDLNSIVVKNYLDKIILDTLPYLIDGPYPYSSHDKNNLVELERLIHEYGWPKLSEVGRYANYAAFLIIQHSSLKKMEQYIDILYDSCMQGESKLKDWATMYDRIKVEKGEKQKYGTQYRVSKKGKLILKDVENDLELPNYRKEVGLPPIYEGDIYLKGFKE